MSPLKLALLNLWRRKLPNTITLIAIASSVACSGLLLRLYLLSNSRFDSFAKGGDAIVGAKAGGIDILLGALNLEGGYPDFLPSVLYQSLQKRSAVQFEDGVVERPNEIREAIPVVFFAKYHDHRILGTDTHLIHRPEPQDSMTFREGKWTEGLGEVVLGSQVAFQENLHVGQTISVTAWTSDDTAARPTQGFPLKISGIFDPTHTVWDFALFSNLEQARAVLEAADLGNQSIWKANVLHYFLIYLEPQGFNSLEALINRRTVGQVISVPTEMKKLEKLTGTGKELGFILSIIILLLGALAAMGTMITRFDAMSLQMAVLRAMGFRRGEIQCWLLYEGAILAIAACFIGGLFDFLFFPGLRDLLGTALPPSPLVNIPLYRSGPVWFAAIAASILATMVPFVRLYRQDIHQTLKGL